MSKKKEFKMPHIVFLIMGLMIFMCILTYVIPAGEFVTNASGINEYVQCERTPVNPVLIFSLIFEGTVNAASVIALLLLIGASTEIILSTKAIEHVLDYLLYKLQDKGVDILVPCMFSVFCVIGAFATEGVIGLFPVAIILTKRLRLDPLVSAGFTVLAFVLGFAASPVSCHAAQALMDVPIYSGFGVRFLNLILCTGIAAVYVTWYAKRVSRNPSCSLMGHDRWMQDLDSGVKELEEVKLAPTDLMILVLFFAQYIVAVYLNMTVGLGLKAMPAVMIPVAIFCGLLARRSFDQIGNSFLKGVRGMSDICIIIGLAGAISLIMKNGRIMDTIAYYCSRPLQGLSLGLTSIGIAGIVGVMNILIPSASAKAASLIPLIKPIAVNLGMAPQLTVQAFQCGDGMMNGVSPFMGQTMGGLEMCKVDYKTWMRWYFPILIVLYVFEFLFLYILATIGWS